VKSKTRPKQQNLFQETIQETVQEIAQERVFREGTKARLIQRGLGYGGSIRYRKIQRPFSSKGCTHLILRSRLLEGNRSLTRYGRKQWVEKLLQLKAKKYHASLYQFSVNSNHLHLLIKFKTAQLQAQFLRDFSGSLALKIKKTFRISKAVKVWDERPFSRLVKGKAFPFVAQYILKNRNEAAGIWSFTQRPLSALTRALEKLNHRHKLGSRTGSDPSGELLQLQHHQGTWITKSVATISDELF
jgi:putative transposase